jgi:DNA repair protein RadC
VDKVEWQQKGTGHRQRLRDKFLERGMDAFTDAEILELLLTFGTPRRDCKDAARSCLKLFGNSLAAVLNAPRDELKKIRGLGANNVFALHFVQGVAGRYLKQQLPKKQYLTSSREVTAYLIHAMRHLKREVFMAIFLDAGHAIITDEVIAEGTINVNTIYPRELIKSAFRHHAAAMVVAHNHPSGSLQPSSHDINLTRTLYLACALMTMQLLDHLLVGAGDTTYSFADHGIMADIAGQCATIIKP